MTAEARVLASFDRYFSLRDEGDVARAGPLDARDAADLDLAVALAGGSSTDPQARSASKPHQS